jgi:cellulose synthase/poly-beta-1,6-N-acetylglucosamine synthase-like glycosyltransferase
VNNLRRNLPYICKQHYPAGYEVLVVNDNSSDGTMELLFDYGREFYHLDYRTIPQDAKVLKGKKFALTIGVKAAKYEHIILTDADCRPGNEYWLQHMASRFSDNKKVILGYSQYDKREGFLNACIRFETYFTALQYLSYAMAGIPYMGVGRNMGYTRELFLSQNIFVKKPHLTSGDDDLVINTIATGSNTAVALHPDSFMISTPKEQWDEWLYQKRRHMTTAVHYKTKHIFLLNLFQVSQIVFYILFTVLIVLNQWMLWVLSIFGIRLLLNGIIHFKAMKRLKTLDIFIWHPFFDVLYLLYYLVMLPGIFNKKQNPWK